MMFLELADDVVIIKKGKHLFVITAVMIANTTLWEFLGGNPRVPPPPPTLYEKEISNASKYT